MFASLIRVSSRGLRSRVSSTSTRLTVLSNNTAPKALVATRDMSTSTKATKPRPVSPHVEIYKFPTAALTSIAHRITGASLTVGMTGIALTALGNCDVPSVIFAFREAAPVLDPVVKMIVGFPVVYHTLTGARHLFWDKTASMLSKDEVENLSRAIIATSGVLTLGLGFYSC